jgi:DNA-binding transcriptional regulator GbsR (MarR family)
MLSKIDHCQNIKRKYEAVSSCLNEKGYRLWAAAEALSYDYGGISLVSRATGLSRTTIHQGIKEIQDSSSNVKTVRRAGGGRKKYSTQQPDLVKALDALVEPTAKGDPMVPLRWTSKSTRNLANDLKTQGYGVGHVTVSTLLHELDYSLQVNKKTLEKSSHADRDAQFRYINDSVVAMHKKDQPTISVDTKKKEIIGAYKNNGQDLCKKGQPTKVNTHDFPDPRLGKVVPYGVYDIGKNKGWVSVGISSDTAEFAVNTIRTWWYKQGKEHYPSASELLITADCGGSNGYRVRLWKYELQKLADEVGLSIHVRHFPPGTSKWNKIEHRLFSYISKNWRGRPLLTRETVVNLIANTTTKNGLKVMAVIDENEYDSGKEISDQQLAFFNIHGDAFHPEWNYTMKPHVQ